MHPWDEVICTACCAVSVLPSVRSVRALRRSFGIYRSRISLILGADNTPRSFSRPSTWSSAPTAVLLVCILFILGLSRSLLRVFLPYSRSQQQPGAKASKPATAPRCYRKSTTPQRRRNATPHHTSDSFRFLIMRLYIVIALAHPPCALCHYMDCRSQ